MSLTLPEICDKLLTLDELTFLELLDISTEELVEAFQDRIEERADALESMFEEDEDD